jgi:hypothetical protein
MALRMVQFLAIVLTALALVPAGAHLFELPNKIDLPRDAYLTVQGIYAGWAWFGIIDLGALVMNVVLAIKLRRQRLARYFAGTAALCFVISSPSSSRGRSRPIRRPPTGRPCRMTGAGCGRSGNTRTR